MMDALLGLVGAANGLAAYVNNSKLFAGLMMMLLNIGGRLIVPGFSKSLEEHVKSNVSKTAIVFVMAWMGSRDLFTAILLTGLFLLISEIWFNEDHPYCIIPHHQRILSRVIDTNGDGEVSEEELNRAIQVMEKARKEKQRKQQRDIYSSFYYHLN